MFELYFGRQAKHFEDGNIHIVYQHLAPETLRRVLVFSDCLIQENDPELFRQNHHFQTITVSLLEFSKREFRKVLTLESGHNKLVFCSGQNRHGLSAFGLFLYLCLYLS